MESVLTPAQMAATDRQAIASGISEATLIGRAGAAVAWHARRMLGGTYGGRVVVVCGKGNNGADGRVAAGLLARWGAGVDIVDLADPPDARRLCRALDRCDLAIDAMFGTGFRGELDGVAATIDEELYRAPLILSVDIPSGVDGATGEIRGDGFVGGAVLAHETVTFGAYKPGLLFEPGRFHAGTVTVADIGLPIAPARLAPGGTVLWTEHDAANAPLERWPQDHKWSSAVVVVGGSPGMTGAPLFAARAAHRCGSGMVVVTAPGIEAANRMSGTEIVVTAVSGSAKSRIDESSVAEVMDTAERGQNGCGGTRPRAQARHGASGAVVDRAPADADRGGRRRLARDRHRLRRALRARRGWCTTCDPHAPRWRVPRAHRSRGRRRPARGGARACVGDAVCGVAQGPRDGGRRSRWPRRDRRERRERARDRRHRRRVVRRDCGALRPDDSYRGRRTTRSRTTWSRPVASAAWIHAAAGRSAGRGPSTIASDVVDALAPTLEGLRRGEHTA